MIPYHDTGLVSPATEGARQPGTGSTWGPWALSIEPPLDDLSPSSPAYFRFFFFALSQAIMEQERGEGDIRGKMILDWLTFVKKSHRLLSIVYSKDRIFTR